MLVLKRRPNQCIWINKQVYIEIANVRGKEVEVHIDFPPQYEVLRGELVEIAPPKTKKKEVQRKGIFKSVLAAVVLVLSVCAPTVGVNAEENIITLPNRTLICDTPLDYYGAYDGISKGKISVEGEFPRTRQTCQWTNAKYKAKVIMVAAQFYLAEVILVDPSPAMRLSRGWVGLSEVK